MKEIARRIKETREKKGLLQREVAEKIGVSRETLVNVENGRSKGTIEMIEPLCKILEVSPNYLILGRDTINELDLSQEGEKLYKEYLEYLKEKHPKAEKREYEKIENL